MQFKKEKIMNPKKTVCKWKCWQTLNSNSCAIGHHKNNKANFNEDLKVDEAFIFGNYGACVGLISKWNLNHLNDPREGTIVGNNSCSVWFHIGYTYGYISRALFSPYGNRHIPIINILLLSKFDMRKFASKSNVVEIFLWYFSKLIYL